MLRPQTSLPFPHRANPSWCASTLKHLTRRVRPTHTVTTPTYKGETWTTYLCEPCARGYEGRPGVVVEKIKGEGR